MTSAAATTTTVSTQAYGEAWYWDDRYTNEPGPFDWYQKYPSLAPLLNLYVPCRLRPRVLVVGCGNSAFSESMVDDGYEDVVNVDISSVVIDAMRSKYSSRPQLKYIRMDVRDMSAFHTASFDAVIDKGNFFFGN
uniref:Methyltransferase domain-containing protein n=1 Tax=Rhizophora mucronata TaxID=61149 RepID=A0A2P2JI86_RHIMU